MISVQLAVVGVGVSSPAAGNKITPSLACLFLGGWLLLNLLTQEAALFVRFFFFFFPLGKRKKLLLLSLWTWCSTYAPEKDVTVHSQI